MNVHARLKEAAEEEIPLSREDVADCLTELVSEVVEEGEDYGQIAEDLHTWFNKAEWTADEVLMVFQLHQDEKFVAWHCPTCQKNRAYRGQPSDWAKYPNAVQYYREKVPPIGRARQCGICCQFSEPELVE